eukprot:8218760-Pyramimonas_sp.AAC.1
MKPAAQVEKIRAWREEMQMPPRAADLYRSSDVLQLYGSDLETESGMLPGSRQVTPSVRRTAALGSSSNCRCLFAALSVASKPGGCCLLKYTSLTNQSQSLDRNILHPPTNHSPSIGIYTSPTDQSQSLDTDKGRSVRLRVTPVRHSYDILSDVQNSPRHCSSLGIVRPSALFVLGESLAH